MTAYNSELMPPFHVVLSCNAFDSHELFEILSGESAHPLECQLELKGGARLLRSPGLDQTVLVALVAGTTAAISALINGLFRVMESRYNRTAKILLRGADGTTVEVPLGTSLEELEKLVEVAKTLNRPEIRIMLPPERIRRD